MHDPAYYKFTDIDKDDVTGSILADCFNDVIANSRSNNAGDRIILVFEGPDPFWIENLGLTVRDKGAASLYYQHANGWGADNT